MILRRQGVTPSPFGRPLRPGRPSSQKLVYAPPLFARYGAYQREYSLRAIPISRCWNDVTILWRPFYLRHWVHCFLEEQGPFLSFEARNFGSGRRRRGPLLMLILTQNDVTLCYVMIRSEYFLFMTKTTPLVCASQLLFTQIEGA